MLNDSLSNTVSRMCVEERYEDVISLLSQRFSEIWDDHDTLWNLGWAFIRTGRFESLLRPQARDRSESRIVDSPLGLRHRPP